MKIGEHRGQGMGAVEVGAAISPDDLYAGPLAEAQQMAQQKQRRLRGPVEVVEYQNDRRARGGDLQQRHDRIEECVALGVRVGASRRGQIRKDIGQSRNQGK